MQQGSSGTSTSTLSDEQILDMELTPGGQAGDHVEGNGVAGNASLRTGAGDVATPNSSQSRNQSHSHNRQYGDWRSQGTDDDRALLDDVTLLDDAAAGGDPTRVAGANDAASTLADDATATGDPTRVAAENAALNAAKIAAEQSDPAWLKALDAQPQGGREAAAEARAWRAAATDVASLDAAYFSADAGARSGLAARLYDNDPGAFRAMLAESARTLALRDPQGLAELARELGAAATSNREGIGPLSAASAPTLLNAANRNALRNATNASASPAAANAEALLNATLSQGVPGTANLRIGGVDSAAERTNRQSGDWRSQETLSPQQSAAQSQTANAFPAEAYRSFETATNDDVARRVHRAIDHTLGTTLPDGMSEGARRRIAEDIFQEVHTSLASDRDLARRLGETLRDWRFDAAARQQVSSLLTGRARAVLPEVARRVVAEWTSSVLATDRAKTARIDAASARRDITGGRLPEPVPASSLRPRDLDYRRLSDEQIMEL